MTTTEPWQAIDTPAFFPTNGEPGVYDPLAPFLPPDLVQLRRAAILERAEVQRQQGLEAEAEAKRQAVHDQYDYLWTAARKFELACRGRDPHNPRNLPRTTDEVAATAFAKQDAAAAQVTRQAMSEARKVLRDAGVTGQLTLNVESPHPAVEPSAGSSPPAPGASSAGSPSVPEAAAPPLRRSGAPRLPGEDRYTRMRVHRFFNRLDEARKQR
jgi:hypothetical protein